MCSSCPARCSALTGDPAGLRELRFAFANADAAGLDTLMGRLAALG